MVTVASSPRPGPRAAGHRRVAGARGAMPPLGRHACSPASGPRGPAGRGHGGRLSPVAGHIAGHIAGRLPCCYRINGNCRARPAWAGLRPIMLFRVQSGRGAPGRIVTQAQATRVGPPESHAPWTPKRQSGLEWPSGSLPSLHAVRWGAGGRSLKLLKRSLEAAFGCRSL